MQRVHADDDCDDTLADEDEDEDEGEDDFEDEDLDRGEDEDPDGGEDDLDNGGRVEDDQSNDDGNTMNAVGHNTETLNIKAFVALGDQVHSILLPLDGVDSWGGLSQAIHEVCEDSDVPNLPEHGIMHIVLNINGNTIPVTGKTPIAQLWRAKALKVSVTADKPDEEEDDGNA